MSTPPVLFTQFLKKANKVHNNKYGYSKMEYVNRETKIAIICPDHGEFQQKPRNHLLGYEGCDKCKSVNISNYGKKRVSKCRGDVKFKNQFSKWGIEWDKIHLVTKITFHNNTKYDVPNFVAMINYTDTGSGGSRSCVCTCPNCDEKFMKRLDVKKTKCPKCSPTRISLDFINSHMKIHMARFPGIKYSICRFNGHRTNIKFTNGGEVWFKDFHNIKRGRGIFKNKKSYQEDLVYNMIKSEFDPVIRQHRIKTQERGYQFIDFYLPDHNMAIEYDGEQHYKPSFNNKDMLLFQDTLDRDKRKNIYCKRKNIELLRIRAKDVYSTNHENMRVRVMTIIKEFINESSVSIPV